VLEVKNLTVHYGHIHALDQVSVKAEQGQIVSIIGANGAGKSTLLRTISGLVKPMSGEILFQGEPLTGKPNKIVAKGIVQVPEGRKVFSGLSVRDNLLVGAYLQPTAKVSDLMDKVFALFPVLKEREKQFAGTLSGGEQQMLAIGRGLMADPKVMLLDEPSLGLAPIIVNNVFKIIKDIQQTGVTIILVEQNAQRALSLCETAYVLELGRIKLCGLGCDLLRSDEVRQAYLGKDTPQKQTKSDQQQL